MQKLIITCAITGAEVSKRDHPQLPVTAKEQAQAAVDAIKAGASVIHLHVRDDQFQPSQELSHFERSVSAIVKAVSAAGLAQPILQFSTGGAVGELMERRIAPLSLKPEMASFNLGTMNFGNDIFVNSRPLLRELAAAFKKYAVIPEFEVYDLSHIDELHTLIGEMLVGPPYHVQFVLGVLGGALPYRDGSSHRLQFLLSELPINHTWGVAGVGRFERPLAEMAIQLGGHVRVGLEDNLYLRKGVLAKDNADLVSDIVALSRSHHREVASIKEAREMLQIGKASR